MSELKKSLEFEIGLLMERYRETSGSGVFGMLERTVNSAIRSVLSDLMTSCGYTSHHLSGDYSLSYAYSIEAEIDKLNGIEPGEKYKVVPCSYCGTFVHPSKIKTEGKDE